MRTLRSAAAGAALVALFAGACGPGGASPTATPGTPTIAPTTPGTTPSPTTATLASTLTFGGPPECPQRPFCLLGLQQVYGLEFAEFVPLDAGGPITVEALANGQVDVALLFSSDPTIGARDFVMLEDDQGLQRADNLVPVIDAELVEQNPIIAELLDSISERLTQDELVELNRQSTEERQDPADIAAAWLVEQGLVTATPTPSTTALPGGPIVVGKTNFYEQDILSELYAQILEANGFPVERQEASGTREVVFPALENGQIDILPEYAATALEFVNAGAGEATADPAQTTELLRQRLEPMGLTALEPAPAQDQNAVVVTRELAEQHDLVTISDLGQPAP